MSDPHPSGLEPTPIGLFCRPGGFHIDPAGPVERAVISHGHADHARPGHAHVLATEETLAVMRLRYGAEAFGHGEALRYGERISIGAASVTLLPAGHILGSAQIRIEHRGYCALFTGDFKRTFDPTATPFEASRADLLITEATFGLPVFRHPPPMQEIERLLSSRALFPERTHVVGVYALGKCQRVIRLLRAQGYDRPIYLHGALEPISALYRARGIELGPLAAATAASKDALRGALVLCPPSALAERWSRRLTDPVRALASGFMRVRARARQRKVELPLVISDHADWDELWRTIEDAGAPEVWVTHGREEAMVFEAHRRGLLARPLSFSGYEDEDSG